MIIKLSVFSYFLMIPQPRLKNQIHKKIFTFLFYKIIVFFLYFKYLCSCYFSACPALFSYLIFIYTILHTAQETAAEAALQYLRGDEIRTRDSATADRCATCEPHSPLNHNVIKIYSQRRLINFPLG